MVTYKLDNTLVVKYPTNEERQASNNNSDEASAREGTKDLVAAKHPSGFHRRLSMRRRRSEGSHCSEASVWRTIMAHSACSKASASGRPTTTATKYQPDKPITSSVCHGESNRRSLGAVDGATVVRHGQRQCKRRNMQR